VLRLFRELARSCFDPRGTPLENRRALLDQAVTTDGRLRIVEAFPEERAGIPALS